MGKMMSVDSSQEGQYISQTPIADRVYTSLQELTKSLAMYFTPSGRRSRRKISVFRMVVCRGLNI